MVPPWTPAPPGGDEPTDEPSADGIVAPANQEGEAKPIDPVEVSAPQPILTAPPARFRGTRLSLGVFAGTGSSRDLRRSLGHYVRTGYGGSTLTTRRFGGTIATARALGNTLTGIATGQKAAPGHPLDSIILAGCSAREVMDAVVEAVRPADGTQDAEASRMAIRDALSELLTLFPEADLLNLDENQRSFAIERFAAIDVFRRFDLDVGKTIVERAPCATAALSRLKQVRDYIKEIVAASFRKMRDAGRTLTAGRISYVVRDALHATFQVFEGYAE